MSDAEPEPQSEDEPKLRRSLLGYRTSDVDARLAAKRAELKELHDEIAALWLAFGQHERTIRHLIAAMEALEDAKGAPRSGAGRPAPRRPQPSPPPAPPPAEPATEQPPVRDEISTQLDDLGGVLDAIEKATRSLERTYADEIDPAGAGERKPTEEPEPAESPDEDPEDDEGGRAASDREREPS